MPCIFLKKYKAHAILRMPRDKNKRHYVLFLRYTLLYSFYRKINITCYSIENKRFVFSKQMPDFLPGSTLKAATFSAVKTTLPGSFLFPRIEAGGKKGASVSIISLSAGTVAATCPKTLFFG